MCYVDFYTSLIFTQEITNPVSLESSVRNVCPLSILLFALYFEFLSSSNVSSVDINVFSVSER